MFPLRHTWDLYNFLFILVKKYISRRFCWCNFYTLRLNLWVKGFENLLCWEHGRITYSLDAFSSTDEHSISSMSQSCWFFLTSLSACETAVPTSVFTTTTVFAERRWKFADWRSKKQASVFAPWLCFTTPSLHSTYHHRLVENVEKNRRGWTSLPQTTLTVPRFTTIFFALDPVWCSLVKVL